MRLIKFLVLVLTIFCSNHIFSQYISTGFKGSYPFFAISPNLKKGDYMERTVVVKLNARHGALGSGAGIQHSAFNQLYNSIGGQGLRKKFPHAKAPLKLTNERGERYADLTLIYEFSYSSGVPLEKVINKCIALNLFEYVEPHYVPHICYTPNDPSLSSQYAITNIQAEAAWGVNSTTARGDTNVVIGITDTGTEPTHADLQGKIKHNAADPIDGNDNDGDGYVDNFSGWDLGENDNDPTYNANPHGVHVSGIAAAATDNGIGVAGVGFRCKFLPIKIADASGALTQSYEGIAYAADHGCAVINCSWGSESASQLGQDVVTYAAINQNALVVAAAGNNGIDEPFYPAAYDYVISVASTKYNDTRSSSSNYNYTVDVCAPGESIYSTWPTNSYSPQTGTSMASPCVAGAAAIVKSFYPSYTALQVGERLKITSDNIYSLMSPVYANKLGTGRINLYNALTQTTSPSVVKTQETITDNNDNTFAIGDTLRIAHTYTNYLGPTTNLGVTLSTTSSYVQILDGTTTLGAVATLGTANNNSDPYGVKILPGTPANQSVLFKLTYSDPATSYTAYQFFYVVVNVDYVNIAVNDIATTISSAGRIGYSQNNQTGGLGFNYMNNGTLLYEAGLMVGASAGQVSDAIRGISLPEQDFQSVVAARNISPAVFSDYDVEGTFNDNLSSGPLPITVHHRAFAWTNVGDRKYVIVKYVIKNTGPSALTNIYAGIFADWDIDAATFASDRASFDAANKMGYAYYSGSNGTYAGVKLLTSSAPVVHYAVDNVAGGGGGIDLFTNGFDTSEKYGVLSTNRTDAGVSGNGADVIDVVSTGPYTINASDSITVAFALLAGDNLADLQNSATNAQIKYDGLNVTTVTPVAQSYGREQLQVFPNPATEKIAVHFSQINEGATTIKIIDITGKEIKLLKNEMLAVGSYDFTFDVSTLANGIYYCHLTTPNNKQVQKLVISK